MADKPSMQAKVAAWRVIWQILAEREAVNRAAEAAKVKQGQQKGAMDEHSH